MSGGLSNMEFTLFQKYIRDKCGIEIIPEKAYLIETRLAKILVDSGLSSFGELFNKIRLCDDNTYDEKIIDAITTNETLWFRDKTPWIILEELYLPKLIELLRSGTKSKVRIWSAAAATGQEAYSTAMCIENYLKKNHIKDITLKQFEIYATDISHVALEIAKKGRYDAITIMRGLDASIKEKFFIKNGTTWEIDPYIKSNIKFMQFNLQNSFGRFGCFDVIFCRYVLIYFSDHLKREVIEKLSRSVGENGIVFLGAYEIYNFIEENFKSRMYNNGVYYTKIDKLTKEAKYSL